MNVTEDMLEILMGKYIDGEITPSEQGMLDGAMGKDAGARDLLEQLAELHEASAEAVASEVLDKGRAAEEIIEQAWRQKQPVRRRVLSSGFLRFAAGVAAGLLIGLGLHFAFSGGNEVGPGLVANDTRDQLGAERPVPWLVGRDAVRNVDYYGFTDEAGAQWIVEGLRENEVRPAVYYGDL